MPVAASTTPAASAATPLALACAGGHISVARFLLDASPAETAAAQAQAAAARCESSSDGALCVRVGGGEDGAEDARAAYACSFDGGRCNCTLFIYQCKIL